MHLKASQAAGRALCWLILCGGGERALARSVEGAVRVAPPSCRADLAGTWWLRLGDDPSWAAADLPSSGWQEVELPLPWGSRLPHPQPFAWYRVEIEIDAGCRRRLESTPLAIRLGDVDSAYELSADGALVGGVGHLPPDAAIAYDRRALFTLPRTTYSDDGRVAVSLRTWAAPESGSDFGIPYAGRFEVGPETDLTRAALIDELPPLLLATCLAAVGLLFLLFEFQQRWDLRGERFWFGASALALAGYTFLVSQWRFALSDDFVLLKEAQYFLLGWMSTCVLLAVLKALDATVGAGSRWLAASFTGFGVLVAATPGLAWNIRLLPAFHLLAVVGIAVCAGHAVRAVRRRSPGALRIAVGVGAGGALFLFDIARARGYVTGPQLSPLGFAIFGFALVAALSQRFMRERAELESFNDLLERRVDERTRALEIANRTKSELLARVSHEIRTPLHGIVGMAELASRRRLDSETREYVEGIDASAKHLAVLIADLLDMAELESGRLRLLRVPFSLREVLGEALRTIAARAFAKELELLCRVDLEVPDRVSGDPGRLRQVLINLLDNAVKFTPRGEIELRVRRPEASGALEFEVRDTGIGIPEDRVQAIFEPLTQADGTSTRRFGGSGLGLSICGRLVAAMGGALSASSRPGEGSSFRFQASLGAAAPEGEPAARATSRGRRVLLLSGRAASRTHLANCLSLLGVTVEPLDSVASALDRLRTRASPPPDLLLLDDGIEAPDDRPLAGRLASESPGMRVLVAVRFGAARSAALDEDQPTLTLPFTRWDLERALASCWGHSEDPQEAASHARPAPDRTLRILVVEDDPLNVRVATGFLAALGHASRAASSGPEALELLARERFDAVLMDLFMPGMDGFETTRRLRAAPPPGAPDLPIVALTASALPEDLERCRESGMQDMLTKPLALDALERCLARWTGDVAT